MPIAAIFLDLHSKALKTLRGAVEISCRVKTIFHLTREEGKRFPAANENVTISIRLTHNLHSAKLTRNESWQ